MESLSFCMKRGLLYTLFFVGMLASLFLIYEHFSPTSKFCTFPQSFDCDMVNKSPYAHVDGLSFLLTEVWELPLPLVNISSQHWLLDLVTSNAFLGFLTLLFLYGLYRTYFSHKNFLWIRYERSLVWMKGIILFSVLYGLYLFWIQHSILKAYCVVCLILDAVLLSLFVVIWKLKQ